MVVKLDLMKELQLDHLSKMLDLLLEIYKILRFYHKFRKIVIKMQKTKNVKIFVLGNKVGYCVGRIDGLLVGVKLAL